MRATPLAFLWFGLAVVASPAIAASHSVRIEGMKFVPESVEAREGDEIVWTNQDIVPHTATSVSGRKFDSGSLTTGKSYRLKVGKPGKVEYQCTFHPTMKGMITVLPSR